ncbi:Hypothetical predicted protein [Octopus vulgaris]|uniref:Uncharacterized protein n=1 Tax=Octopus vulgaris TaxID=6645 RepID=A0AA36FJ55_OCTVU|nr:Hypothetical predicted protein [Octopus vulgaris]
MPYCLNYWLIRTISASTGYLNYAIASKITPYQKGILSLESCILKRICALSFTKYWSMKSYEIEDIDTRLIERMGISQKYHTFE